MKQQMGFGPTNWFYEQGGNGILNLIRKALWPTAIVATALMLFGALGSAVNADDARRCSLVGRAATLSYGGRIYVAIYVVVDGEGADTTAADVEDAIDALVASCRD